MKRYFDIMPLFPTPVGIVELDVDAKSMLKWMQKLKYKDYSSDHNLDSFQTKSMDLMKKLPKFQKEASKAIDAYILDIWKYKTDFQFSSCWATKNLPKGYSGIHKHCNNWLSAVYYPEECCPIQFNRIPMLEWDTQRSSINEYNSNSWSVKPYINSLIIFPANLPHSTTPNTSNKIRYSLAMNIIPKGKFGVNDNTINL